MWLTFALLAGLLFTLHGLLTRHVLRGQTDAWVFSFYFSAIGAIVSLPFMLVNPVIPTNWHIWPIAMLVGFILVAHNLLFFLACKHMEPSLVGAVSKVRLIWVFLLSIWVGQAVFSWSTLFGCLLAVSASGLVLQGFRKPNSAKAVFYTLISTGFYAILIVLYKYLFSSFNTASLTFFVTFLPATILNFIFMPNAVNRIRSLFNQSARPLILACLFGAIANLAMNQGLASGDATAVLVTIEACLVLTLVGEHIFLKEKDRPFIKITAVLLAIAGAVIIRLYS